MQRVTAKLTSHAALAGIRAQSVNSARASLQLSNGKRVQRPSDDPIAFRSIASLRGEIRRLDAEIHNIEASRSTLNMSLTRLTEARTLVTSAQTTAQQGRDSENRSTHAASIDSLLEQMVRLANDQSESRYVFGGGQPLTPPLDVRRDAGGKITDVRLSGSQRPLSVPIGSAFSVDTSLPAQSVFGSGGRGQLEIVSRTGIVPGSGTDSAQGSGSVTVEHLATTYLGGSGVAAGAGSTAGDNIVGQAGTHTLSVVDLSGTGAFGEVSLDGGPAVAFTSADTNLQVGGPSGEIVFLDLSSVTAGFNGSVDILANGTVSIDGGLSSTALDFSANQQLVHAETGETINIDTTGARRTGEDVFEHSGGANIFQVLIRLRDDLRGERGLSEPEFQDAVTRHLGELERLTDHLLDYVGEQAVALENLDSAQSLSEDVRLEAQVSLSRLEDADIAETVLDLQAAQTVLQSTYAATALIYSASLLDYL